MSISSKTCKQAVEAGQERQETQRRWCKIDCFEELYVKELLVVVCA